MAKHANPTLIGGFVVGAAALAVAGILVFGAGNLFAEEAVFIAYFESSVEGLDVGAPVKYRGVQVGRVSRIEATWDPERDAIRIPVELTFSGRGFRGQEEEFGRDAPGETMSRLVDLGLRAQLQQGSFVTGKLFVAMEFHPGTTARFIGGTELPEVPTTASELQEVIKSLEELPIEKLLESAISAAVAVEKLAGNPRIDEVLKHLAQLLEHLNREIDPLSDEIHGTLVDARALMRSVDGEIKGVSTDLRSLLQKADAQVEPLSISATATLDKARETFEHMDEFVGDRYALFYRLATALEEIGGAARAVRVLAAYLERHPEALLSGKGN